MFIIHKKNNQVVSLSEYSVYVWTLHSNNKNVMCTPNKQITRLIVNITQRKHRMNPL